MIDQGISEGKTLEQIRADESAFQAATARLKEESHASIPPDRLTFWVRGIDGDAMAFWPHSDMPASQEELLNQVSSGPDETIVVRRHRYRGVFICDPLRVQRDYARIEDDQRAVQIDTRLEASYRILGYNPIRVPVAPLEQRAMFILQHIPTKILRHR